MTAMAVDNLLAGLAGYRMPNQANEPVAAGCRPAEGSPLMRVAVVDIGTNSTRLLIADVDGSDVVELDRRSIVTRLGEGVDATGALGDEPQERVFGVLESYAEAIDAGGCEARTAVMTSAVRDASNGARFAEIVRDRYGLDGRTLSGDEEARFTFLGATASPAAEPERPLLVIDIGGGSTELVVGRGREVDFHVSTQIGVVRHTERHLHSDPPTRAGARGARRRRAARLRGGRAGGRARAGGVGDRGGRHRDPVRGDRPRARPLRRRPRRGPRAVAGHARRAAGPARVGAARGAPEDARAATRTGRPTIVAGVVSPGQALRAFGLERGPGLGARHPLGCRHGDRLAGRTP